jgi:16S rRNA processing protein RimM
MLMRVVTDFPERLQPGVRLFLGDAYQEVHIRSLRAHNQGMLIAFNEFEGKDAIDHIRNQWLFVRAEDRPALPEGQYYQHQLIGLKVISDEGQALGQLAEILETGANDVYVVRGGGGKDVLLPAIEDVILGIDLDKKEMRVHVLPGLID